MQPAARNVDSLRRANLSSVLGLVHRTGGVSRSQLTATTNLTRSTVAVLVGELVDMGLVVEREAPSTNRVGRPSPLVCPTDDPVAIAVNPELDAVTVGVVGFSGRVHARIRHEVDHVVSPAETVDIVVDCIEQLGPDALSGRRVLGLGLAVPGLVRSDGLIRWAPHLRWSDSSLAEPLAARLDLEVAVGNDASLAAVAERLFGAGSDTEDIVYLNGGASGIGGGVIAGGALLGGASGYAGEFGQNRPGVLDSADRKTTDGVLEDEVSRDRLLAVLRSGPLDEETLERRLLTSTAPTVLAELGRQRRILGVALANAVNVLNPSLVVLGGFLATLLASDPDDLAAVVAGSSVSAAWRDTRIIPAALGTDRILIGAAELVFERVIADPVRGLAVAGV
jgi:predicted NBD/HSP70 family sugar kinase